MKRWTVLLLFGGLVISFQNCSRSGPDVSPNKMDSMSTSELSSLNPSEARSLEIPSSPTVDSAISGVSAKAASGDDLFASFGLSIQPKTGVISVLQSDGEADPDLEFCMTSAQIAQLEGLLEDARICEAQDASQDDVACTMDYRFPYAKLHFSDRSVGLGERYSGCSRGPDLCGDQSQKLQSFLKGITDQLKTLTCNFQSL